MLKYCMKARVMCDRSVNTVADYGMADRGIYS
jgi:hypothetical protein